MLRLHIFFILLVCCIALKVQTPASVFSLPVKQRSLSEIKTYRRRTLPKTWRFESTKENPFRPDRYPQTRAAKTIVIENVRKWAEGAGMLMTVPVMGVATPAMLALKKAMPEGTIAKIIKNRIFKIGINGTQFDGLIPYCKGENMYFFIPPDVNQQVYSGVIQWMNENNRKDGPVAIALEGRVFTGPKLREIALLPPKMYFIQRLISIMKDRIDEMGRVVKVMLGKDPIEPPAEGQEPVFMPSDEGMKGLEMLLNIVSKREAEVPLHVLEVPSPYESSPPPPPPAALV